MAKATSSRRGHGNATFIMAAGSGKEREVYEVLVIDALDGISVTITYNREDDSGRKYQGDSGFYFIYTGTASFDSIALTFAKKAVGLFRKGILEYSEAHAFNK